MTSAIPDAVLAAVGAMLQGALMLAAAPLLNTVIKKMKARLQNRQGPPLLQGYYDLSKLLRKEPVRSEVASWIYSAGPPVYFAAVLAATTLVPVVFAAAPLEAAAESSCWWERSHWAVSRWPLPPWTRAARSAAWARAAT